MNKISEYKKSLIIFMPNDIDWLGFKITKKNPYSFHHIIERKKKRITKYDNLAILTKDSHIFLNEIKKQHQEIYEELNILFLELILTESPPATDYYDKLNKILSKIK